MFWFRIGSNGEQFYDDCVRFQKSRECLDQLNKNPGKRRRRRRRKKKKKQYNEELCNLCPSQNITDRER
jgi:hypothetical protein